MQRGLDINAKKGTQIHRAHEMIRRSVLALLLVSIPFGASCAIKGRSDPAAVVDGKQVQKHWRAHERLLQRIVGGGRFDPEEYEFAVEFFETTTGIPASDRQTYVGRLPSQTLADDLNKWWGWFREHERSLYWDPESSRIRVRGAEDETPPPEGSRGREG